MPLPLLQTKLYIPTLRPQFVARPAVTAKLQAGAIYPLTLVAAPAGFGKSTLVSEWIRQTDKPVAWLSLDEEDNDSDRFFVYLVAALRSIHAHIGETTLASLQVAQLPLLPAILTPLLNDLSQLAGTFVLVLDDYHLITAAPIHEALTFLIEHLPPTLRLIITTRLDPPLPLARWRVRGQLAEIRADDLRFDAADATTFFNKVMGLQLTAADIDRLEMRTEGWIAGLQLAALSLQGRADIDSFIQSFSGSHRHVFSYLIEEVLNQRPAGTLDFLLQTAIMERFNADLCNAVTGLSDSQALLEKIEQANLFLIPLDDERKWYRYHHLFAEVLRAHLQRAEAQTTPTLHRRAAAWFETQELWPEAIYHALAATDFATVARLIEQVGIARFAQPAIQHSLLRWLSLLPAALVDARPRLCLLHAWICFAHLDFATGLQWVEKAQRSSVDEVIAETAAMRTLLAAYSPTITPAEAIAWGEAALATLPTEQYAFRGIASGAMAMAYLRLGDVRAAEAAMAEANRTTRIVANFYLFVIVASNQAAMQRAQGYLRRAITTSQESIAWLVQQGALAYPTFSDLHLHLADLLREQNELDAAQHHAETAIVHSEQEISPVMMLLSRLGLMRIRQARGEWTEVWALIEEISSLAQQYPTVIHNSVLPAIRAQYQVAIGISTTDQGASLERVWRWAQSVEWEEGQVLAAYQFSDFVYLYEHSRLARAQVFIAWARHTNDQSLLYETLVYLQRQAQMAATNHLGWYLIKLQLLQALIHHTLDQIDDAFVIFSEALARAEPEGYVRIFLDEGEPMRRLLLDFRLWLATQQQLENWTTVSGYTTKLLAVFLDSQPFSAQDRDSTPSKVQNLVEPLTEREVEILQLVANGLSNSQLADRLIVTVGTVKKHLNNIYGKLGVASRTQAIVRGRELGLLAK